MFDAVDAVLERVVDPVYTWLLILLYGTYISAALGLWYVYPDSVHVLTIAMQLFIAFVLMLRFNPLRKRQTVKTFDERLIFSSALFLLVNAGITGFLQRQIISNTVV
jgi:hypothetical protein